MDAMRSGLIAPVLSALLTMALLCSCRLILDADDFGTGGGVDDAGPDGTDGGPDPDAITPGACDWQPLHFDRALFADGPLMAVTLNQVGTYQLETFDVPELKAPDGMPFDASLLTISTPDGPIIALVVAELLVEQETNLRVIGDHPLIIASAGNIVVRGKIDASSCSNRDGAMGACVESTGRGPGSDLTACSTSGGVGHDGGMDGSGGGGGGFGALGSFGGGNSGGQPGSAVSGLPSLRGGCRGGIGNGTLTNGYSEGGSGGGGIELFACSRIEVRGQLLAVGEGGRGGQPGVIGGGGGGGGSGGYIGLDAPEIQFVGLAQVSANGGGGGGGATPATGRAQDGLSGSNGLTGNPLAPGGSGGGSAGGGGYGGSRTLSNGTTGTPGVTADGSGGGGGGVGFIVVHSTTPVDDLASSSSPAPITAEP